MGSPWRDDPKTKAKSNAFLGTMADKKGFVRDFLSKGYRPRIEHLLQLYFYPEASQYHGPWKRSVYGATFEVPRLKKNNKFPNKDFVFQSIWLTNDPQDMPNRLDGYVEIISGGNQMLEAPKLPLDPEVINNCMQYLEEYHVWLAAILCRTGYIKPWDAYGKLDELLSKSIYKKHS